MIKVSVIAPAFNEEQNILNVLEKVNKIRKFHINIVWIALFYILGISLFFGEFQDLGIPLTL